MIESIRLETGEETVLLPRRRDVRKLYLEVTSACNFNCITCIRHSWTDTDAYMPWEVFAKVLRDAKELPDITTVHFGGFGESTLHPRCLDMVAATKAAGYRVEMISNGSLLTRETMSRLVALGVDWLFVSLDGPTAESFEQIRPGTAGFTQVTDAVRELQRIKQQAGALNPRLGVEFVMMKQNFAQLPAIRRLAMELGADRLVLTNLLPYHSSMKDEILYGAEPDFTAFGMEASKISVLAPVQFAIRAWRSCKFIQDKAMVISPRGEISPCYALLHSYQCYIMGREKQVQAQSFGNVMAKTLAEIWQEAAYVKYRYIVRNGLYPSCTDCQQVDGCHLSQTNEADCWGNQPSCGDCLWARGIIVCP